MSKRIKNRPLCLGYLRQSQLAARLNMAQRTIIKWRKNLGLPHVCINGRIYYNADEVDRFIKTRFGGGEAA